LADIHLHEDIPESDPTEEGPRAAVFKDAEAVTTGQVCVDEEVVDGLEVEFKAVLEGERHARKVPPQLGGVQGPASPADV
jgi:hypothetical protein